VAPGQRAAKSCGRPGAKWLRRGSEDADVSWPGSQVGGATTSPSELKSLTQQSSYRKMLDGPATRPITPLAVENGVGKLAAQWAPNASMGKRAWRTPIPHLVPAWPQGRAGTLCFCTFRFRASAWGRGATEIRNPKLEVRTKFQGSTPQGSKPRRRWCLGHFRSVPLGLFRVSSFGFRISLCMLLVLPRLEFCTCAPRKPGGG
jgi:hypothetical protein